MKGWRDGRKGDGERGRARREVGSVFLSETGIMLIGINIRSLYQCKEYLERPGCMAYVEGFFFVLALFVFVKAFHLLAVTNQILQGEL